jgi:hypothetical protein
MTDPVPALARPDPGRPWASALAWWAALLLTAPALASAWFVDGQRLDVSLAGLLQSADATMRPVAVVTSAYLAACAGVVLAFVLRCQAKRGVILALALTLALLEAAWGLFGLGRLLVAMAGLGAAAVAVEVLRQNRGLVRQLRAARVSWAGLLGRTLRLWSPSLLLIGIGMGLGQWMGSASMQAIYASGLIEPYCSPAGPAPPVADDEAPAAAPCADLHPPAAERVLPLSLRRSVEENVADAVWAAHRQILDATTDAAQWATRASARQALDRHFAIVRLTLLPVVPDRADSEAGAVAADPELVRLRERRKILQDQALAPLNPSLWAFLNPAQQVQRLRLLKQRALALQALDAEIARRDRQVRADFLAGNPAAPLKQDLARRLDATIPLDADLAAARRRLDAAPQADARATVRAELLRILATRAPALVDASSAVFGGAPELAQRAGLHRARCLRSSGDEPDAGPDRVIACATAAPANGSPAAPRPLPFVDSVRLSLDAWAGHAEREIETGLLQASLASVQAGADAQRLADALYARTPRRLGLKPDPDCGINPFCHAANHAKGRAEASYRATRADFEGRFRRAVQRRATLGVTSAQAQIDAAREELHADLRRSHAAALEAVTGAHAGFELVGTVLTVFLAFAALKSFLYVLALGVFHESGAADVGFDVPPGPEGGLDPQTTLSVPAGFVHPLRSFALGLNQTRRLVLWKPWVALGARLWRLRFLMNHGRHATAGAMQFPLGPGRTGVRWRLQPGEQVVFHFRDLLAFSDNVQIRTEASLRLSTLLLGSYFFHVAQCRQGEGLLLLSLPGSVGALGGDAADGAADDAVEAVSVGTLKAWNLHTRFRVAGELSVGAVFKDGFLLGRRSGRGNGRLLAGASHGGELSAEGLVWYARTFLMPI